MFDVLRAAHRAVCIPAACILLILSACEAPIPPDPTVEITGSTMGTSYNVKLVPAVGQTFPADVKARMDALLANTNKQMSTYDTASELSRFNQNTSTDWVPASKELHEIIAEALRISELSSGAFDITVGPSVNLWGFGPEPRRDQAPSEAAIAQARERVGYFRLHVRDEPTRAIKKDRADVMVDLSAIAKGYAVDQLATLAESIGAAHYLVSIAGEIRAKGNNGKGQPWTIAVEKPVAGQRAIERLIRPGYHSVSTSGDYRNFFEQGGQRYSHIVNPRTGRPVKQSLVSVTVVTDRAMEADAMATMLMAAGPEMGFQLALEHHLAAFFIVVDAKGAGFQERATPEFEPYLLPQQP